MLASSGSNLSDHASWQALWSRQQRQVDALQARQTEAKEELAALRECLEDVGCLSPQAWALRLHRRRFARALEQHPLHGPGASLVSIARTRELALSMASFAGHAGTRHFAATSHACARNVAGLEGQLLALFPPAIYAVGGCGDGERGPLPSVERLDPDRPTVIPLAPGPTPPPRQLQAPRAVCAAVALAGRLFVLGGRGADGEALGTVEVLEPGETGGWRHGPALRRARGWVSATAARGALVALGGEGDDTTLDAAEELRPGNHSWEPLPSMRHARWAASAAAIDGEVFVVGGHGADGTTLDSLECLRRDSPSWCLLPGLRRPRAAHAACALKGRLYVVGGFDAQDVALTSLERFDPASGRWELLAPMGLPRWGLGAVSCNGRLFVIGGTSNGGANSRTVARYDPRTDSWEADALRLRTPRRCLGVVTCR